MEHFEGDILLVISPSTFDRSSSAHPLAEQFVSSLKTRGRDRGTYAFVGLT